MALSLVAIACIACLLCPSIASAQPTAQLERELDGVEVLNRVGEAVPPDLTFVDQDGRPVKLGDFAGAPLLLTFNYSTCPMLCSLQLAGLSRALKALGPLPQGAHILRVSLTPKETPEQSQKAQIGYVHQAGGGADLAQAWRFLVGDAGTVKNAADAVGFRYRYRAESDDYIHVAMLFVITADGRVGELLGGIDYDPDALRAALDRAARNELHYFEGPKYVDAVINCFNYDAAAGHAPLALVAMRVSGLVLLGLFALFWLVLFVRKRAKRRARQARATAF